MHIFTFSLTWLDLFSSLSTSQSTSSWQQVTESKLISERIKEQQAYLASFLILEIIWKYDDNPEHWAKNKSRVFSKV
jgi:hypothetical protein